MNNVTSLAASQNLSRIKLTWSAPTGATHYLIYRKDEDVGTDLIYLAKTTATNFIDFGVPRTTPDAAAINYEYTVKASDGTNTASGADVSVACTALAHADVDNIGIGHPRYKIGSTSYTASLSTTSYGSTANASNTNLNDSCARTLQKSLSRI
jgi:hypothetical protein